MLKRSNSGNGKEKSYSVHSKSQDIEIGDSDHSIVLRGLIRGFQPIVFDESISAANKS
jgi:dihydroxyacetone kinase